MSDYAVVNPVTGQTLATYPTTTDAELETAIASAAATYRSWREVPVPERAARIRRAAKLHRERRDELAAIIVREMGKPLAAALGEVDFAADITEYYADNAERITGDQPIDILGEGTAVIRRSPLGVLLGIMPWNFPYYQVARFAAPNLVVGNTILLKHAPQCPESAAAIERDLPRRRASPRARTCNAVHHERAGRGRHRRPARAGRLGHRLGARRRGRRGRGAGRNLKKVALELGGSDPFILLSTDDLDAAVTAAVEGAPGQHRPVVQRRQAIHRRGRALRRVPREVHGGDDGREGGRPVRGGHRPRPAVVARGGRAARRPGRQGARAGRHPRRGRDTRRRVLRAHGPHRRDARHGRLPRGVLRSRRRRLPRSGRGRGGGRSPTTPATASGRTSSRRTRSRRPA